MSDYNPSELNYAESYSQSLAELWPEKLYFHALFTTPNNNRFRWTGGKTIQIPTISTTGRVDADRDTIATAVRNYDNTWESKELSNHRKWSTLIHPADIDQTNYAANITNITSVYNNEQKFPEMDAYCISKLYADWTELGYTPDVESLTAENVLEIFDTLMQRMTEKHVPLSGRILYVTPAVMTMLKNAEQLSRTIDVKSSGDSLTRTVNSLDGVEVALVPANLMKTAYDFTEGWQPDATADQIEMLLVHPSAVITPVSYQFAQLDPPGAFTEGKYLYFEESCEDVFILNKKADAIQFVIQE